MENEINNEFLEQLVQDTPFNICDTFYNSDDFFEYVTGIRIGGDEDYSYEELIDKLRTYILWAKKNHRFSNFKERIKYDLDFSVANTLNWIIKEWRKEDSRVDDFYDKYVEVATKKILEEFNDLL